MKKRLISWLLLIMAAVLIGFLIRQFAFGLVRIVGTSMEDTLYSGDVAFVTRFDYYRSTPNRGDLVLVKFANRGGQYVKRIVGLPNEHIDIIDGMTYIDGTPLNEPYISSTPEEDYSITLGENEYLVLGDNRLDSYDSRAIEIGPVNSSDILGRVRAIVWPLSHIDLNGLG